MKAMAPKKGAEPTAGIAGMLVMVGLYLLGGSFMVGFGAAVVEAPMNMLQCGVGIVGGFVLSRASSAHIRL